MLDMELLLAPISADQPCGEDIAFSPELDAIAHARRADDPTLEQGAWVTPLKEADWKFVAKRCAQLIEQRSKDLRLAVWLAEASAKTAGMRGLGDSLAVIAALCERYWDHLHPLPDDGSVEQRIGNLHWMATRAAQLILEIPITEGAATGFSMKDFEVARARGGDAGDELDAARRQSSRAYYEALMRDCEHCAAALDQLERAVDERMGNDGPGFSAAKDALQSLVHCITPAAREAGALAGDGADPALGGAGGAGPGGSASGPLRDRAQALAQLRTVAEFFRRTEPHSPVAYLAEKAAQWGEQPLHVWLRAVLKDDASLARLEELLGVENG